MSKELVATSLFAIQTDINMKIPVAESYLPVQNVKGSHHDLPKELVYKNDARNAHFQMSIKCSNGLKQEEKIVQFSKGELGKFLQQIQKIQDELNTYM